MPSLLVTCWLARIENRRQPLFVPAGMAQTIARKLATLRCAELSVSRGCLVLSGLLDSNARKRLVPIHLLRAWNLANPLRFGAGMEVHVGDREQYLSSRPARYTSPAAGSRSRRQDAVEHERGVVIMKKD